MNDEDSNKIEECKNSSNNSLKEELKLENIDIEKNQVQENEEVNMSNEEIDNKSSKSNEKSK